MGLRSADVQKLDAFLHQISTDVYPEHPSDLHTGITQEMWQHCLKECRLQPGASVLDVGCGQGVALRLFRAAGFRPIGITLAPVDVQACRDQGFDVYEMDQSFLDFPDDLFDFVWCRHCLEHSIFPFYTLHEIRRVLKDDGFLYVEVPSPDTSCRHQSNRNHYSVLGKSMWADLMVRSGFVLHKVLDIDFQVGAGPDRYWSFLARKAAANRQPQSHATVNPQNSVVAGVSDPGAPQKAPASPRPATGLAAHDDSAPTEERQQRTYVILPLGNSHGWGVCGKHITRELAGLTDVRLIIGHYDRGCTSDELEHRFYQGLLAGPEEMEELKTRNEFDLVLQGIGDHHLQPHEFPVRGRYKVGYTFFEATVLSPDDVRAAGSYFDVVATGCEWCTSILRDHGLANAQTVIQGIDPLLFNATRADKELYRDRFVVFSGGKFEFRKGQDLVIRAFKALQDRHADVLLVGSWYNPWHWNLETMSKSPYIDFKVTSPDYVQNMANLLAAAGLDLQRVIILPPYPNVQMPKLYQNSDVGLFPNRCEGGTNLVLMEYMACGKPVIASFNSGHKDVVSRENALLVEQMRPVTIDQDGKPYAIWDEPDLDETIERLEWAYQHRDAIREYGKRAAVDMSTLTWRKSAERFYELLQAGV